MSESQQGGPKNEWLIREVVEEDLPFIYATWTNSVGTAGTTGFSNLDCKKSLYFAEYCKIIDGILQSESIRIAVAVDPQEPKVVYGYMVSEGDTLHYAFTKQRFYRYGIARSLYLYLGSPKLCSHKTKTGKYIMQMYPELIYNPYILFRKGRINGNSTEATRESGPPG